MSISQIPSGWTITRSDERIVVQHVSGAFYAAAKEGESGIAESILYMLADSLLSATLSPAHIVDGEEVEVVGYRHVALNVKSMSAVCQQDHPPVIPMAEWNAPEPLMTVAQHQRMLARSEARSAERQAAADELARLLKQSADEYRELRAMLAAAPTPPASEQQQTVQQPHTVEFVGKTCQRVLMAEGKPYPRTCAVCGLSGPCKSFPRENDQRLNPHLAKGEGV